MHLWTFLTAHFHLCELLPYALFGFVDFATANPINPQGTAGGANVFNSAPLFGNSTILGSGSSGGGGSAGTGSSATAAQGGPANGGAVTPSQSTAASLLSNPIVWIVLGVLGIGALGIYAVKIFRTK
jgi:hypothetical protein